MNSENASGGTQQEYILDDDECPLAILMNHPSARGKLVQSPKYVHMYVLLEDSRIAEFVR